MLARACLNEEAPQAARSELLLHRLQTANHSEVEAKRRPPQYEPLAHTACRDALRTSKHIKDRVRRGP